MADNWTTIESDPGVFTELIEKMGVEGVQVEELWSLDETTFARLSPIYGLIFLFKWDKDKSEPARPIAENPPANLFFANQVITNACATQAILSILLNCPESVEIGETLKGFREFATELPPDMRGEALRGVDAIRTVHNSFARPEPFVFEEKKDDKEEGEAFHFVAYVPFEGRLWELDGLQHGPIDLGQLDPKEWPMKAAPFIQERMAKYSEKEIRFNLLALLKDRRQAAEERMINLEVREAVYNARLAGEEADMDVEEDDAASPSTPEELQAALTRVNDDREDCQAILTEEQAKRDKWAAENVRRKHNYVPFAFNLLKLLAKKDVLNGLVDAAVEDWKQREEDKKAAEDAKKKTGKEGETGKVATGTS
jgi:ubiquitin carboxyl-terminal hydrolase L5